MRVTYTALFGTFVAQWLAGRIGAQIKFRDLIDFVHYT